MYSIPSFQKMFCALSCSWVYQNWEFQLLNTHCWSDKNSYVVVESWQQVREIQFAKKLSFRPAMATDFVWFFQQKTDSYKRTKIQIKLSQKYYEKRFEKVNLKVETPSNIRFFVFVEKNTKMAFEAQVFSLYKFTEKFHSQKHFFFLRWLD